MGENRDQENGDFPGILGVDDYQKAQRRLDDRFEQHLAHDLA